MRFQEAMEQAASAVSGFVVRLDAPRSACDISVTWHVKIFIVFQFPFRSLYSGLWWFMLGTNTFVYVSDSWFEQLLLSKHRTMTNHSHTSHELCTMICVCHLCYVCIVIYIYMILYIGIISLTCMGQWIRQNLERFDRRLLDRGSSVLHWLALAVKAELIFDTSRQTGVMMAFGSCFCHNWISCQC